MRWKRPSCNITFVGKELPYQQGSQIVASLVSFHVVTGGGAQTISAMGELQLEASTGPIHLMFSTMFLLSFC